MQDSKFADIYFSEISSFIFKVPVEKVFIDEEELHGIDVGELTRNIAKKKKPDVLQAIMWHMLQVRAFFQQAYEILWII